MSQSKYFLVFILSSFFTFVKASDFGKLRGQVLTKDTNMPLMGVNVVLIGTNKGSFTDDNGYYTILGIPSGEYDIRFEYIGYSPKIIQTINIQSDLSTTINVKLVQTVIAGEEIIVSGKRSIIQVDETASKTYLDADEINKLPVIELRDAVMLQAGVFFDPIPVLSSQGRGHAGESGTGETRYTIRGGDQEENDQDKHHVDHTGNIYNIPVTGRAVSATVHDASAVGVSSAGPVSSFLASDFFADFLMEPPGSV